MTSPNKRSKLTSFNYNFMPSCQLIIIVWQRDWILSMCLCEEVTMALKINEYHGEHLKLADAYICMRCWWPVSPRQLPLPRQQMKTWGLLPLCSSSFLHVSHDDSVRRAFRTTATSDLDTQSILSLHHVHLPNPTALSGLWDRKKEYICHNSGTTSDLTV